MQTVYKTDSSEILLATSTDASSITIINLIMGKAKMFPAVIKEKKELPHKKGERHDSVNALIISVRSLVGD